MSEPSDEHGIPITVLIRDTLTGKMEEDNTRSLYFWRDGNGSCDCNREIVFGEDTSGDFCIGAKRYIIVEASHGIDARDLNMSYDRSLVQKAIEDFHRERGSVEND